MAKYQFISCFLLACGCGSAGNPPPDAIKSTDTLPDLPGEAGPPVCIPGPQTYLLGDPPPACCSNLPYAILFHGTMTSKDRVYDNRGTLIGAAQAAVIDKVWFATSDPGSGDDSIGDYSFRILSDSGQVMWASATWDPFTCFDCAKGHPPIEEVSDQWSAPLIRGMAFFEILDKRLDDVLLLLDLRGIVQLFCMNNPCVDTCRENDTDGGTREGGVPVADGGGSSVVDAAARE